MAEGPGPRPPGKPPDPTAEEDDALTEGSGGMDPEDPILRPIQQRYEKALRRQLEDATLSLRQTSAELTKVAQRREDVGVELYGVQQHLARLAEALEKQHEGRTAAAKRREAIEQERDAILQRYREEKAAADDLRRKYFRLQSDLDRLAETLVRVEQFNGQMQAEIAVERRAAYKAEEATAGLEGRKRRQDFELDALNEQLRHLTERLALHDAQLAAQRQETQTARETLSGARTEMEAIHFEKQQLLQQWKTSLVGLQRRGEALQAAEDALTHQKEQLLALDLELQGAKTDLQREQEAGDRLAQAIGKAETESAYLLKQMEAVQDRQRAATERFAMLKKTMDSTDTEAHQVDLLMKGIQGEFTALEKRCQKADQEVRRLEAQFIEALAAQAACKKGASGTLQAIERLKATIQDKELQVAQVENELARIRIDTLETESHTERQRQALAEAERELAENDRQVERAQTDIRRRHDEIERRQKALDKLNREFDELLSKQGGDPNEAVGSLEATLTNLSRAIAATAAENQLLQRGWIRAQTELVALKNQSLRLQDDIRDLQAQETVLHQKRLRLTGSAQQQAEEIADLEREIEGLHLRRSRLDERIALVTGRQGAVAGKGDALEADLLLRLQERQREASELEGRIADLRDEKQRLLGEILEAERTILCWERKIQVAKETERALDPSEGREEVTRMRLEITAMEQRLAALKRDQKRKVDDMAKVIDHREVLRDKGKAAQACAKAGLTKDQVQREVARLTTDLRKRRDDARHREAEIRSCLEATERTLHEVVRVQTDTRALCTDLGQLQEDIQLRTVVRGKLWDERNRRTKMYQRYRDAEKGLYRPGCRPENFDRERAKVEERRRVLAGVLRDLEATDPTLTAALRELGGALMGSRPADPPTPAPAPAFPEGPT